MVIDDFDVVGVSVRKAETEPLLVVDPDAVRAATVAPQRLEPVSGRHAQEVERRGSIHVSHIDMRESSHQAKRNHAAEYRDKGIRAYVILPDVTESAMRESRFARTPVVGSGVDRCMGRPLWRRPSCKVGAWVADVGGVVEGQEGEALFRYAGVGSGVQDHPLRAVGIGGEHQVQAAQAAAGAGLHFDG